MAKRNRPTRSLQEQIAHMMCEDYNLDTDGDLNANFTSDSGDYQSSNDEYGRTDDEFTDDELRLAKQFIDSIGSVDRASELLSKVESCEDCLGLVGDDDDDIINDIATMIPSDVDMPNSIHNMNHLGAMYNSSAMTR